MWSIRSGLAKGRGSRATSSRTPSSAGATSSRRATASRAAVRGKRPREPSSCERMSSISMNVLKKVPDDLIRFDGSIREILRHGHNLAHLHCAFHVFFPVFVKRPETVTLQRLQGPFRNGRKFRGKPGRVVNNRFDIVKTDSRFVLKEIFRLRKRPLRLLRRKQVVFVHVLRSRAGARNMPFEEAQRFRNAESRSYIDMHRAAVQQIRSIFSISSLRRASRRQPTPQTLSLQ